MAVAGDALFCRLYCLWTLLSLVVTHRKLARYAKAVGKDSIYGHFYYPKPAGHFSRFFGLAPVPHLAGALWHAVFASLCALLAFAVFVSEIVAADSTPAPKHSGLLFALATPLSLLYFARVRTHGLIHNKADLVPWVLPSG